MKYDTEKLLKLIADTFDEYKEKYKYKLNQFNADPVIKALTKFKKYPVGVLEYPEKNCKIKVIVKVSLYHPWC